MFVSAIFNFMVNFRKIISLEPHMKLERLVDEVFFRICIFYMPKFFLQIFVCAGLVPDPASLFTPDLFLYVNLSAREHRMPL